MAAGTLINFRGGSVGRRLAVAELTLASGTGTVTTPFTAVEYALITEKNAVASGDAHSWTASGGTVTVDSDNGSSTAVVSVLVIGY